MDRFLINPKFLFSLLFLFPILGKAGDSFEPNRERGSLQLDVGVMKGDTKFQIGGAFDGPTGSELLPFPISELDFPLDVATARLKGTAKVSKRLDVEGSIDVNLTKDAGKTKDSDFGVFFTDTNSLDIFSESDAELDMRNIDLKMVYRLQDGPRNRMTLGLGYRQNHYEYVDSNLDQFSPSLSNLLGADIGRVQVAGDVSTYEVDYRIPYAEFGVHYKAGLKTALGMRVAYSPIVSVEDRLNLLLRSRVGEGDSEGTAVMLDLEARRDFTPNIFGSMRFSTSSIDTKGRQTQTQTVTTSEAQAGVVGSLDHNSKSSTNAITIGIGMRFQ